MDRIWRIQARVRFGKSIDDWVGTSASVCTIFVCIRPVFLQQFVRFDWTRHNNNEKGAQTLKNQLQNRTKKNTKLNIEHINSWTRIIPIHCWFRLYRFFFVYWDSQKYWTVLSDRKKYIYGLFLRWLFQALLQVNQTQVKHLLLCGIWRMWIWKTKGNAATKRYFYVNLHITYF